MTVEDAEPVFPAAWCTNCVPTRSLTTATDSFRKGSVASIYPQHFCCPRLTGALFLSPELTLY